MNGVCPDFCAFSYLHIGALKWCGVPPCETAYECPCASVGVSLALWSLVSAPPDWDYYYDDDGLPA